MSETVKTYSIPQLRNVAKQQGYKMAALETAEGERKQNFNPLSKKIDAQLTTIQNRVLSDLFPDGIYFVCMSQTINGCKNADRYPIIKGKMKKEDIVLPVLIKPTLDEPETKTKNILSYEAALKYQSEISDLKMQVALLQKENTDLQLQLEQSELEEEESKPDVITNGMKFLGDQIPNLIPALDRYFDLQEKKLKLEEMKITQTKKEPERSNPKERVKIVIGSQEHLDLIDKLYTDDNETELNKQLDKLEAANIELYNEVLKRLEMEEESE